MSPAGRRGLHFPLGDPVALGPEALHLPPTSKRRIDPQRLARPLTSFQGIGSVTARRMGGIGLHTVGDLLLYVPFRHEPLSRLTSVSGIQEGGDITLRVRVLSCSVRSTRRPGLKVLEALVGDESGSIVAVWYNQNYLKTTFEKHPEILVRGALVRKGGFSSFVVKRHEVIDSGDEGVHTLGLVPVYPAAGDLSVHSIRAALSRVASEAAHMVDPLPSAMRAGRRYLATPEALLAYHFPRNLKAARRARERLAFEELLLLQLALLSRRRRDEEGRRALSSRPPGALADAFVRALPFTLTGAQRRVIAEIESDLARVVPMRRLLQGDVGSGKTVVAAYCLVRAVEDGGQAAVMAPTEVLADQHAARLAAQLAPVGLEVGLLKGGLSAAEKRSICGRLAQGELNVVVGTHALIQEGVTFRDLRVAVVDEQHRFGVQQRDSLSAPGGEGVWPHTLHMTATPIPRTLSLTLYGDLDVSVIDELPPGRTPVRTRLVRPAQRTRMWEYVRAQLGAGRQAYVVCPLIDESDALQVASATATFEDVSRGELADYRVLLLHGRLPSEEKQQTMAAFAAGEADVLVSTTVIEVGVDVANATVMVIEGARRFGLSQLHQLRGRVGRGAERSDCMLMVEEEDEEEEGARDRLKTFVGTTDGFALAEHDLRARGEGQLFGGRQSGFGDLRVARLLQDQALLIAARAAARALLAADPALRDPRHVLLAEAAEDRFGDRAHWLDRA